MAMVLEKGTGNCPRCGRRANYEVLDMSRDESRIDRQWQPTNAEYHARAGAYRLLLAQAALTVSGDPGAPAVYARALDELLANARARNIITELGAMALGAHIEHHSGDTKAAIATIVRELRLSEDLAGLDDAN